MLINEANIIAFGNLKNRTFRFTDGINLLYGPNESGKTTLLAFIKFIFYGVKIRKSPNDLAFKEKYMPWDGNAISGNLRVTDDNGHEYIITRTVSLNKNTVTVIDASTGTEIKDSDFSKNLGKIFLGLGEESFSATAFLSDLSSVVHSDRDGEILSRLANLTQSGAEDISYIKASEKIKNEIAYLSSERRKNAVIPTYEDEIELIDKKIKSLEEQVKLLDELQQNLEKFKHKSTECSFELANYSSMQKNYEYDNQSMLEKQISDELDLLKKSRFLNFSDVTEEELEIIKAISANDKKSNFNLQNYMFILSGILIILGLMSFAKPFSIIFCFIGILLLTLTFICTKNYKKKYMIFDKILKKYNCLNAEEFLTNFKAYGDIRIKIDILEDELMHLKESQKSQLNVTESKKISNDFTIQDINDKIMSLNNELDKSNKNILYTEEQIDECRQAIVDLENLNQERESLNIKIHNAKTRLDALNISQNILTMAFEELKHEFAPQLAKEASVILSEITGGKYNSVLTDDNFSVKLKTGDGYNNGLFYSRGTYEQIYLSMRFALLKIAVKDKILPAFLDDAFGFYDDDRFINVLKYIIKESHNRQIFLSSCRSGEYVFFRNQGINIIEFTSERND